MSVINPLPSLELPPIKSSIGDKSIKVNQALQATKLKICHFFGELASFLERGTLKHIFGSKHFGQTHNFGKWKDIPLYVELKENPMAVPQVSDVVERYAFKKIENPTIKHDYFGNCHGACLYLASKALEMDPDENAIDQMSVIAQDFEDGIPFLAMTYQATYIRAHDNCKNRVGNGELLRFLRDLLEEYQQIEEKKRALFWEYRDAILSFDGNPSAFTPFLEGTRKFLEEGRSPAIGYCDYMKAFLKAEGLHCSPATHGALREVEILQANLEGRKHQTQLEADVMSISGELAGLVLEKTSLSDASPLEVVSQLSHFDPGFYLIVLPCYDSFGKTVSSHSLTYHKIDESLSFLYDPNFAVGFEDREGAQKGLIERDLSVYCGPILKENPTTLERIGNIFKRIANVFTTQANPPLFKEIRGLDVYKLQSI